MKQTVLATKIAVSLSIAAICTPATADLTFTQTVDGWWENTYTWDAQIETIVCLRSGDPKGTEKSVWGRVVQTNGSKVGTAVFCTTMVKTSSGISDRWDVSVPAGMIMDKDFWDASSICFEIVECDRSSRQGYRTDLSPYGNISALDYPPGELSPEPDFRYVSLDPAGWDDQAVRDDGFDFAVYGYMDGPLPIILNHVDELGLSTFNYDQTNAFGTGFPYDPNQLVILGVDLDPNWDFLAKKSNGLQFFDWQIFPGGGMLFTDQGQFQILRIEPLAQGWIFICPADLTEDGQLDFFDISAFLNAFNVQDPLADFNADGQFDFFDVSAFLNAYLNGCP
jgi:hypothetical protein